MVTTWKIIRYENGKTNYCKSIQSLKIDNKEITNQNTSTNILNIYFLPIDESLKSVNHEHTNKKETNPVSYVINSFHRPFPKMKWRYTSTHEIEDY